MTILLVLIGAWIFIMVGAAVLVLVAGWRLAADDQCACGIFVGLEPGQEVPGAGGVVHSRWRCVPSRERLR